MIKWPGQIQKNKVTDELVASPDIYRTILEVCGAELPDHPIDGYNLLPFLKGQTDKSPREKYYYFGNQLQAMRKGKWKLRLEGENIQLFNLQVDPGERFNRAAEKPDLVEEIREDMKRFAGEVGVPVAGTDE